MSWGEKARCYIQLAKWFVWNWLWLAKDLIKAAIWPLLKLFLNFESDNQKQILTTQQLQNSARSNQ